MIGLALAVWTAALAAPAQAPAADTIRDTLSTAVVAHVTSPATEAMAAPQGVRLRAAAPGRLDAGLDLGPAVPRALLAALDSAQQQPRAKEVGDWYERRLMIHRFTAYAVPALFAWQYYYGDKLYDAIAEGEREPENARDRHRLGRTLIISAFAINTVTGAWNWWDNRSTPEGRTTRALHALSMLAATGGFTYAGIKLANDFDRQGQPVSFYQDARRNHRNVAIGSMAVTLVSGVGMWIANR
jgi:hypothetical protein